MSPASGSVGRSTEVTSAPTHHATTTRSRTKRPGPTEAEFASPAASAAAAIASTAATRVGRVEPDGRYRDGVGSSSRRLVSSSGVSMRVIVTPFASWVQWRAARPSLAPQGDGGTDASRHSARNERDRVRHHEQRREAHQQHGPGHDRLRDRAEVVDEHAPSPASDDDAQWDADQHGDRDDRRGLPGDGAADLAPGEAKGLEQREVATTTANR